jgi:hypothetical protein
MHGCPFSQSGTMKPAARQMTDSPHTGGDPQAADRARGHPWSPVPPFAAVVVETEPLDEWLTANSLWWLMLAPADQLTPQALVER